VRKQSQKELRVKTSARTPIIALIAGLSVANARAAQPEWPQFRGPNGSGIAASDAQPATTWSDSQNVKWKVALPGPGSSSPIVTGERVFVTCYAGYGDGSSGDGPEKLQRHLVCLERRSGKVLWDKSVPAELPEDSYSGNLREHGYASNTPVTDGERVYAFFGKTGVLAFDLAGQQLWKVNLGKQSSNRRWGSGASPILYHNLVIVNAAEEGRAVCALDKLTGKEAQPFGIGKSKIIEFFQLQSKVCLQTVFRSNGKIVICLCRKLLDKSVLQIRLTLVVSFASIR